MKREKWLKMLKFEARRAKINLDKSIEYRKTLEWVMLAIEGNVYNNNIIIEEY